MKRWWLLGAAAACCIGGTMGFRALWSYSLSDTDAPLGELIHRIETDAPLVALTFDDGPSKAHTAEVLDHLSGAGVTATFFVNGEHMDRWPDAAQALADAGHELGNHSYSHSRMVFRSARWFRREIDDTDAAIRSLGHEGIPAFRPPYGQKLWGLARALDDRPMIMWDVASALADETPDAAAARVVDAAQPGSIILMHVMWDSRATERAAIPLVIEGLRAKGLEPVTLQRLMGESGR